MVTRNVSLLQLNSFSGQVEPVVVVGPKGCVALGTLALAGFIPGPQTVEAEHVEALGQHGILAGNLLMNMQII